MHQNDIFFIFKKLFLRSAYQNDPKHTKKLKFLWNTVQTAFPNGAKLSPIIFIHRKY
jgi:hypothetical protein